MNSPESPTATGLEHLAEALAQDAEDFAARKRAIWLAVGAVQHHAANDLASNHLDDLAPPRADLTRTERERQLKTLQCTAEFVIRAYHRALMSSTNTLRALAAGTPSPVHGSERAGLSAAVRRPLVAAGYNVTPDVERTLSYKIADILARALTQPAQLPLARTFLQGTNAPDDLVVDHDEVDWRTGEPLATDEQIADAVDELLESVAVEQNVTVLVAA